MEVREAEAADLAAAHAAEDLAAAVLAAVHAPAALEARVPVVSEVRLVITIIITAPISVGDSVRAVITVAEEDVSAR